MNSVIISLLLCTTVFGLTRRVSLSSGSDVAGGTQHGCSACGGTQQAPICQSIGCALDLSAPGDRIEIEPGTYSGTKNRDLSIGSRAIQIVSVSNNPLDTIIDCGGGGGISADGYLYQQDLVLSGFTIQNCAGGEGAAILLYKAVPILSDLIIKNNRADYGAVYLTPFICSDDEPMVITNLLFIGNNPRTSDPLVSSGGDLVTQSINYCPLRMFNVSVINSNSDPATRGAASLTFNIEHQKIEWDLGYIGYNYGAPNPFSAIVYMSTCTKSYLSGLTFEFNTAGRGALSHFRAFSDVEIVCCVFRNNTASVGVLSGGAGGVIGVGTRTLVHNTTIIDNTAHQINGSYGSGIYFGVGDQKRTRIYISNSRITDNHADLPIPDVDCTNGTLYDGVQNVTRVSVNSVVGSIDPISCAITYDPSQCIPAPTILNWTQTCPGYSTGNPYQYDNHPVCPPDSVPEGTPGATSSSSSMFESLSVSPSTALTVVSSTAALLVSSSASTRESSSALGGSESGARNGVSSLFASAALPVSTLALLLAVVMCVC